MKILRVICTILLMVPARAMFAWEHPATAPETAQAPADQDKQRDTADTKKQLESLACGPSDEHHTQRTEKDAQPLPAQPPDKALVYVMRPTHFGGAIQTKLAVDGKWVGINRVNNYFYVVLDPGPHYFCSQAENRGLLSLVVEAGKTYYLQQKITMGLMKARNDLEVLDEEEGKKDLAKCKLSVFEEKK
jgi:uncharacterized protein DUF2846